MHQHRPNHGTRNRDIGLHWCAGVAASAHSNIAHTSAARHINGQWLFEFDTQQVQWQREVVVLHSGLSTTGVGDRHEVAKQFEVALLE